MADDDATSLNGAARTAAAPGDAFRVTVVVPVHNRAQLVTRAIGSVLGQSFHRFELVVVDDASTDGTAQVVRSRADPRIRLLRLEQNRGAAAARNAGIEAARGTWVAFLDSDDEWLPGMLEALLRRTGQRDGQACSVVYCYCWRQREGLPREVPPLQMPGEGDVLDRMLLMDQRPLSISQCMVRRSALIEVGGFDASLPSGQDIDLWLRLASGGHRFALVSDLLAIKHEHDNLQISRDPLAIVNTLRLFERRWGSVVRRRAGAATYRRWLRRRLQLVEDVQYSVRGARAGGGAWAANWWYVRQRLRLLGLELRVETWICLRALIFAVVGPAGYARLVLPTWSFLRRIIRPPQRLDRTTS